MGNVERSLTKLMNSLADFTGKPQVFLGVILLSIGWFGAGLFIDYQTWFDIMDLVIFVSTFFLLFVVQGSQNADTEAIQDKLDEIIDTLPNANNRKKAEEERIKQGKIK